MTATDQALERVVHDWVRGEIPGDERLAYRVTGMAMSYRARGATIEETADWVRLLVNCWLPAQANGRALALVDGRDRAIEARWNAG